MLFDLKLDNYLNCGILTNIIYQQQILHQERLILNIMIYEYANKIIKELLLLMQKPFIFVFDIDGTLLHRNAHKIPGFEPDYHANSYSVYLRPNLYYLAHHMNRLAQQAQFMLWTSMKKHNADKVIRNFDSIGLKFDKLYTQQNCNHDLSKDLTTIMKDFQTDLQKIYLIDDSPKKRIKNQNFIHIKQYLGTDHQDKQIIRIVKQLYQLTKIPWDEQVQNQALTLEIQHKYRQISITQKNNHKYKTKKINGENPQKQQIHKTSKNNNKLYKQKKQQKKQQSKPINEQQQKQQQIKFNENTKVIVFDLSKTLMVKMKKQLQQLQHLRNPSQIQGNIIYNRPHLDILQKFIDQHKNEKQIRMIVWTTMTGKKVVNDCKKVVKNMGVQFDDIINGVQSKQHPGKDLKRVCEAYGCKIQNTILIDDSHYKQVVGQNFMSIQPFTGDINDIEMIRIVGNLDKFIKCQKQQCAIKLLVKQYEQQLQQQDHKYKQMHSIQRIQSISTTNHTQDQEKQRSKKQQIQDYCSQQIKLVKGQKIRSQLREGIKIKCIVFDINQTLITRRDQKIQGIAPDSHFKQYYNYKRPHLKQLKQFMMKYDVKVCLFSTIKERNCVGFLKLLADQDLKFDAILSQDQLQNGKKNLQTISSLLNIPLQNIILVDDSRKKKIEGQNFIQIQQFNPQNRDDDSLIYLISELEKFCQLKPQKQEIQ